MLTGTHAQIKLPYCRGGGASIFKASDAAKTSSFQSSQFAVEDFTQVTIYVKTTNTAGTSPTLNVRLQKLLADASTWHDIASFTQITGNGTRVMSLVSGGNKEEALTTNTLAAGTLNAVAFGAVWRLNYTIAGTSPTFDIETGIEALA